MSAHLNIHPDVAECGVRLFDRYAECLATSGPITSLTECTAHPFSYAHPLRIPNRANYHGTRVPRIFGHYDIPIPLYPYVPLEHFHLHVYLAASYLSIGWYTA